jgi:hypothetical protein
MTPIVYDLLIDKDKLNEYSPEFLLDLAENECITKYAFTQDNLHRRMVEQDIARVSCVKDGKIEFVYIRFAPALRVQHNVTIPKLDGIGSLLHASMKGFAFAFGKDEPLQASFSHNGTVVKVTNGIATIEAVITRTKNRYTLDYTQLVEW